MEVEIKVAEGALTVSRSRKLSSSASQEATVVEAHERDRILSIHHVTNRWTEIEVLRDQVLATSGIPLAYASLV